MSHVYKRSFSEPETNRVIVAWKQHSDGQNFYSCYILRYNTHFKRWQVHGYPHYYEFNEFEYYQYIDMPPNALDAFYIPQYEELE
jgi:hypothetical protein